MSNNLVSQQMSIQNIQMGQLDSISNNLDSSVHMGMRGQGVNAPALQQMSMPNMQMGIVGPNSSDTSAHQISVSGQRGQHLEYNNYQQPYNLVSNQYVPPNNAEQQSSLPVKRKTIMDSTLDIPGSQKLVSNKRVANPEHRPWLHQTSSQNKSPAQMQSLSTSHASSSPRPQPQLKRSTSTKAGPQQLSAQKNNSGQPSPKYRSESSDSVRSKLRESLGAALALVSQEQDKSSSASKQSQNTGSEWNSQTFGALGHASPEKKEENKGSQNMTLKVPSNSGGDYTETSYIEGENRQSIFSSQDESIGGGLFVNDELLQGNGLSWVLESDMGLAEKSAVEQPELGDSRGRQQTESPEILASKIEAELYKLYGGVNKKYKEKGRSLLFNLKDPNNPELRERVVSGDIAPDRLCAMSAEELASRELSEWRMAKAEELAQMVVLPDSDGDMRRLVKKTHKGEFQVEVEPEDHISVEVAVGASSVTQMRPKPSLSDKKKNRGNSEDHSVIMIPSSDGSDLMQGLMVDDELKDAEFLPPIVSLDEFMESLNAEPPFENLPVDAEKEKATPISEKVDSLVGSGSKSPDVAATAKPTTVDLPSAKLSSAEVPVKYETAPVDFTKSELVWEGLLQLNLSGSTEVMAIFKSGEKAFAKAWPGLVEIKGRVRLDAFEKFLQGLPMSRSRAVMAVQFICKEGSTESERMSLKEVADSYVVDERVGFAEPASGVELYVCPPDLKTREMLGKLFPKDQLDALNSIVSGLIGVIVWRKPHITPTTTVSPNHKNNISNKHNSTSSRRSLEKDSNNLNVNITAKHSGFSSKHDDDDDVPPGFGPPSGGAARDEDDLPEFNFSSGPVTPRPRRGGIQPYHGPNSRSVPRPVDEMRELIHKYGQPETNNARGVWNDDDDDMPEWHPDEAKPLPLAHPQAVASRGVQQPMLRGGSNVGATWQQQQQGGWMGPNGVPHGHGVGAYQPNNGQPWRRDAPSRGF